MDSGNSRVTLDHLGRGDSKEHKQVKIDEADIENTGRDVAPSKEKRKNRSRARKTTGKAKGKKKGVVYLSRIPPYMRPAKVKHLLSAIGKVRRLYLAPEGDEIREKRKRSGGNSRRNYTEGWVEFESKSDAKRAALLLNCKSIEAGNKRSYYHDDLWAVSIILVHGRRCVSCVTAHLPFLFVFFSFFAPMRVCRRLLLGEPLSTSPHHQSASRIHHALIDTWPLDKVLERV